MRPLRSCLSERFPLALAALLLVCLATGAAAAPQVPADFADSLVVGGFTLPTSFAFLPDGRVLVSEQFGQILLAVPGHSTPKELLVENVQYNFYERGLLGIAIDPRWPERPYVYAYFTALDSTIHIARYKASGVLDDPYSDGLTLSLASRYDVIRQIPDHNPSHNAGTIRFGLDGMLYTALADDMAACSAQDTVSLRGVLLRLDVRNLPDGPGGPPALSSLAAPGNPFYAHPDPRARLVYAMGLRNPFRFHIDPRTGQIFIADVGLTQFEEISVVDGPGLDMGWPYYEGPWPQHLGCEPDSTKSLTSPIHSYDRSAYPVAAVVGAGVYRPTGTRPFPPEYDGNYFFIDFYEGFLRRIKKVNGIWQIAPPVAGQPSPTDWGRGYDYVTDFLVGKDGSLWYLDFDPIQEPGSELRKITFLGPYLGVPKVAPAVIGFAPPAPSPSRGPVHLSYALSRAARTSLEVYDAAGRRVRRLEPNAARAAGIHSEVWDGRDERGALAAPGVYLALLIVDGEQYHRRIAVLR